MTKVTSAVSAGMEAGFPEVLYESCSTGIGFLCKFSHLSSVGKLTTPGDRTEGSALELPFISGFVGLLLLLLLLLLFCFVLFFRFCPREIR